MKKTLLACTLLASLTLPFGAIAGPFADFEADLRDSYGQYRIALFQSNSGNAEATAKSMQALSEKWVALNATWGKTPPPQYEADAAYGETLAAVSAIITQASAEVAAGDLPKAHATLEDLRANVGDLHLRNGIVTFSDRMNAYHAKMEDVLSLDLKQPNAVQTLGEGAAILEYLVNEIAAHPAPEAADPAYAGLVEAVKQSVATLQTATRAGDAAAAATAVGGLKVPYSKLFAKFG